MHSKIVKNASWIIGAKIVQSILAFVISGLTARYLGPSEFGIIGYAQSITTFFLPVSQLGFTAIIVHEIIAHPNDEGRILGTSLTLSSISAILCSFCIFVFVSIVNVGERETIIVCCLYSTVLLMQSFELIQYWFQAKYLSKYTSITMLCAYVIVSIYKIVLLVLHKSVYWFAVSYTIDYFVIAVCLHVIYHKLGGKHLSLSKTVAKRILSKGKFYIISGVMITIFGQTDRIMLKLMKGDAETGYYSAAAVCAGLGSFFFGAIIDSMRPAILENKVNNKDNYEQSVVQLYSVVIYSSIIYSVGVAAFSRLLILALYGSDYSPSISVLQILVWYTTFSYFGGAKDIWILAEGKQKYLLLLNFCGALANVILNFVLIPNFGAVGAAIASLITQVIANVFMCFVIKNLRRNGFLFLRALNPLIFIKTVRCFVK